MAIDRRRQTGGLIWSTDFLPRRLHLFPPRLLSKNKMSVCRPLHEMGRRVNHLHCCVTHSRGVLKPGNSWSQIWRQIRCHCSQPNFELHVTSRHVFTSTSVAAFGKGGILHLRFRKTGRDIAALTLEQICCLFYLKRAKRCVRATFTPMSRLSWLAMFSFISLMSSTSPYIWHVVSCILQCFSVMNSSFCLLISS